MHSRIHSFDEKPKASSLPRGGFLKVGEKVEMSKGNRVVTFAKGLDYFRPTGDFATLFSRIHGDKCKSIEVVFYSDDMESVAFQQYQLITDKGKLFAKGDGKNFNYWDFQKQSRVDTVVDTPEAQKNLMDKLLSQIKSPKGWEIRTVIRFVLVKMSNILCSWEFATNSEISGNQLISAIDIVKKVKGSIVGQHAILKVNKHVSHSDLKGRSYPIVSLLFNFEENNVPFFGDSPINALEAPKQEQGDEVVDYVPYEEFEIQVDYGEEDGLSKAIAQVKKIMYVTRAQARAANVDESECLEAFFANSEYQGEKDFVDSIKERRYKLYSSN